MKKGERAPAPLSLFHHWVVDCAIKHNAAIKAALALEPGSLKAGRSSGEAEVSRLSVALIDKLHSLSVLVKNYGADEVFGPRSRPLTEEEKRPARL